MSVASRIATTFCGVSVLLGGVACGDAPASDRPSDTATLAEASTDAAATEISATDTFAADIPADSAHGDTPTADGAPEDIAMDAAADSDADLSTPTPKYRFVDFHTHCDPVASTCDGSPVEGLLGGEALVVTAALEHYAIAVPLGDPFPAEISPVLDSNAVHQAAAASSPQVRFLASLDCLSDTPGSAANFTAKCLADADAWLAAGASGFKDHAGKTFDGDDVDVARWVGAYNRLAGWCSPSEASLAPNRECLTQPGVQMPLSRPEWRAVIKGIVEDRGVPLLTHAAPWYDGPELCADAEGGLSNCHDAAANALVDFAAWAKANLSEAARRRIVIAHFGFLQQNEARWRAVLDAGLTMDLAQTPLSQAGCNLRTVVADYSRQLVIGTDLHVGDNCVEASYQAWTHAFLGPMGEQKPFPNTCRGTMMPVGAELGTAEPGSCGIAIPDDAADRLMFANAIELLGL